MFRRRRGGHVQSERELERLNELVGKVERSKGKGPPWLVGGMVGSQTIRFHSKRWDGNSVFDHLAYSSTVEVLQRCLASYSATATLQGRGRIPPCAIERDVRRGGLSTLLPGQKRKSSNLKITLIWLRKQRHTW